MKDFAFSLSLANLAFVSMWSDFGSLDYFVKDDVQAVVFIGAMLNVLLLAAALTLALRVARSTGKARVIEGVQIGCLALLILPIDWFRRQLTDTSFQSMLASWGKPLTVLTACCLVTVAIVVLFRWSRAMARTATVVAFVLLPCVLATFPRALRPLIAVRQQPPSQFVAVRPQRATTTAPHGTVLWLLFDELDERAVFLDRSPAQRLPNLDRLVQESFVATAAYPPRGMTYLSMPSLLTGTLVSDATPIGASDLLLSTDREQMHWRDSRNVFASAQALGFDTAMVGWFHPYCRVFADVLSSCYWEPLRVEGDQDLTLADAMSAEVRQVIRKAPLAQRLKLDELLKSTAQRRREIRRHQQRYVRIRDQAMQLAVTPDAGLVFIHWPIPHLPGIYDPATETFSDDVRGYLDNVSLVDRTVGELRAAMEQAGTWEGATILITADHWWRASPTIDHRVPVIIKTPGQSVLMRYDKRFNTVLLGDLVLDMLGGEIRTGSQVSNWLDAKRTAQPLGSDALEIPLDRHD